MKRRNHAIRTTTSTRTRLLQVIAGIAVIAVLAGIYTVRMSDQVPTADNGPVVESIGGAVQTLVTDAGEVPVEGPSRNVTIYVDGWTLATLDGAAISARAGIVSANVNFTALDADAIDKALDAHPDVIGDVIGRLVSADRRVECATGTCKSGKNSFDPHQLVDASAIPVFGPSYKDWGITGGLHAATIAIPEASDIVSLSAAGYTTVDIDFGGVSGLPGEKMSTERISGVYVGAAYGRLFPIRENWRDATSDAPTIMQPRSLDVVTDEAKASRLAGSLAYGPGDKSAVTGARGLTDSELTYLSSPSTGCGTVPVCSPVKIPFTRTATTEKSKVCGADNSTGVLLITLSKYNVPFAKSTHVGGSYGTTPVSEFKGSDNGESVVGFTGEPLLTLGATMLYGIEVLLVDDRGIVAVAGARDASPITSPIPTVAELFGGIYHNC